MASTRRAEDLSQRLPWVRLVVLLLLALALVAIPLQRLSLAPAVRYLPPTAAKQLEAFAQVTADFGFSRSILLGIRTAPKEDVFSPRVVALNRTLTDWCQRQEEVSEVLSLASGLSISAKDGGMVVKKLLPSAKKKYTKTLQDQTKARVLGDPLMKGSVVSADARGTYLIIQLKAIKGEALAAFSRRFLRFVERQAKAHPFVELSYTGQPITAAAIEPAGLLDAKAFAPVTGLLFLMFSLLWLVGWQRKVWTLFGWMTVSLFGIAAVAGQTGELSLGLALVPLLSAWLLGLALLFPQSSPLRSLVLLSLLSIGFFIIGNGWAQQFATTCMMTSLAALSFVWLCPPPSYTPAPAPTWFQRELIPFRLGMFFFVVFGISSSLLAYKGIPDVFYPKGSRLQKGQVLANKHFQGASPLFVRFQGDLRDPITLKAMERLGKRLEAHPSIHAVQSMAGLISRLNLLLNQAHRVPDKRSQIQALWLFLEGQPALKKLVRKKGKDGILQARVVLKDSWHQRSLMSYIEQARKHLPRHAKQASWASLTPLQRKQALSYRTTWMLEGVLLWLKTIYPTPPSERLRPQMAQAIEKAVKQAQIPASRVVLEANRLQKRLWGYLKSEDCDLELNKKQKFLLLRALLIHNRKGTMLQSEKTQAALQQALKQIGAPQDKSSIRYGMRSLMEIARRLYKQQQVDSLQRSLFGALRYDKRWIQAFTIALRKRSNNQPQALINKLRAELVEIHSPLWIFPAKQAPAFTTVHTGIHAIQLQLGHQSVFLLGRGLFALGLFCFVLCSLLSFPPSLPWRISLGLPAFVLITLGVMGLLQIPLSFPNMLLLLLQVPLYLYLAFLFLSQPKTHRDALPLFQAAAWLSIPAIPFLFASLPLLQQLAQMLTLTPWVILLTLLWMLHSDAPSESV